MKIKSLPLEGACLITLAPHHDQRGYFMRIYDEAIFREYGLQTTWVQESQSRSTRRGVIRGLHFQRSPHTETKLVWVSAGAILDVIVDLRVGSPTYGQWEAIELSANNYRLLYIPKGFAHGFCTLTDEVIVHYKMDCAFAPQFGGGIRWDDADLGIEWPTQMPVLSEKDRRWPRLAEFESPFKMKMERPKQ